MQAATKTEGVGDSIAVVVLLQRSKSSKFIVYVDVEADVGFRSCVLEAWSARFKRSKHTQLGPFGPGTGVQSIPKDVDDKNLHDASTSQKKIIERLSYIYVLEKVATKEFYSNSTMCLLPSPSLLLFAPAMAFLMPIRTIYPLLSLIFRY